MTAGFVTATDGVRLAWEAAGSGVPVIALAGLTRTMRDFDFGAPHLGDVRLIRMDARGRGLSERAPWESYNVAQEARDVLALMDHLALPRAAILGTSRGGLVAMALAATVPDRLTGVCLNDIGPVIDRAGLDMIGVHIGRPPGARSFAEAAAVRAAAHPGWANVPEGRWRAEVERLYIETDAGLANRYDPELRRAFTAGAAAASDAWPVFDALKGLPLALIRGAASDLLTAETATAMRHRRPDMHFAEVPGRGHVPWLDEPEALAAIRAWLKDLP
ncbi:MAG: alpha/beta hydrolase [Paracoccaceae bacterium]